MKLIKFNDFINKALFNGCIHFLDKSGKFRACKVDKKESTDMILTCESLQMYCGHICLRINKGGV